MQTLRLIRNQTELVCSVTGEGPCVLLLHAGGERRTVWKPIALRLAQAGYRTLALDQRGHGESGGRATRLSELVADTCALIAHFDVPMVLVGASLGGFVSLLVRATPPTSARVAGIVLVDVVPDPEPERARTYVRSVRSNTRRRDFSLVEDIFSQAPTLRVAAAEAAVPLALVRGEGGVVSDDDLGRLRALVSGLVERSIAGAGHLVARTRPEQLADTLLELFGSLPLTGWSARREVP